MSQGTLDRKDDPCLVLGLPPGAGDEEVRAAYLHKIKEHPPDRDPEQFERIRDAYQMLQGPRQRALRMLLDADPRMPLASLLDGREAVRRHVGPGPWLKVLKRP